MTLLTYLQDTYLFESSAQILGFWEDDIWRYIILDTTIFYPQWGWQPADTWEIIWDTFVLEVFQVKLQEDGVVYHYFLTHFWKDLSEFIGNTVSLKIDSIKRLTNAKNHSAWHLIDIAFSELWLSSLQAGKWYHFPNGCYVEYIWSFEEDIDIFQKSLEEAIQALTHRDIPIIISETKKDWITVPIWKQARYVAFEWFSWCGCWWTHVTSSQEIWNISIRKVKYKNNVLRISYEVISK